MNTGDSGSTKDKPNKTVLLSYRFGDQARSEVVLQIAARLRFFSIDVVLDQRSLDYGEDIKEFMQRQIRKADAIVVVVTDDYNQVLSASSGPGEGIRFEAHAAMAEKAIRPDFQIIPLLLDGVRPVAPFDQMKCAVPEAIDEIVTQLGLAGMSSESRVLRQRYRIDKRIAARGMATVFEGWDMVADLPIEIYMVHRSGISSDWLEHFERVVKGRSSAFSPFLLNVRDSLIDKKGSFCLITERFEGTDLEVWLAKADTTHPFGALCIAFQVCLALHELHSVGVTHGGLAPRCIRLNRDQTCCKIVDFEFATPQQFVRRADGAVRGYLMISPPEAFDDGPLTVQRDLYQVGELVFELIFGKPPVATRRASGLYAKTSWKPIEIEDPELPRLLLEKLSRVVEARWADFVSPNAWLLERVRDTSSISFLREKLVPLLTWCLAPNPVDRPRNCAVLLSALKDVGVPVVGHLVDPSGIPVMNGLFTPGRD